MVKINKFEKFYFQESLVDDFLNSFNINESSEDDVDRIDQILNKYKETFGEKTPTHQEFADFYHELRSQGYDGTLIFDTLEDVIPNAEQDEKVPNTAYKRIEKKVLSDLKLDTKLVFTFGAGIGAMYPVIDEMMQNLSLNVDVTKESIVLLTIACFTILFLEEKKCKSIQEEEVLTKDSRSMLEELRMRGIGDGIVKKVIKAIKAIKNIFSIIGKHIGAVIGGVIDMFGYTAILIPIMNAIFFVIGKYDMSVDSVIQNFFSIGIGIASRIAKHGLVELINKLRGLISNKTKQEIIGDLETPVIQKFGDMTYGDSESEQEGELIKEQ